MPCTALSSDGRENLRRLVCGYDTQCAAPGLGEIESHPFWATAAMNSKFDCTVAAADHVEGTLPFDAHMAVAMYAPDRFLLTVQDDEDIWQAPCDSFCALHEGSKMFGTNFEQPDAVLPSLRPPINSANDYGNPSHRMFHAYGSGDHESGREKLERCHFLPPCEGTVMPASEAIEKQRPQPSEQDNFNFCGLLYFFLSCTLVTLVLLSQLKNFLCILFNCLLRQLVGWVPIASYCAYNIIINNMLYLFCLSL
jgi:hypothetical protein